MSVIEHYVRCPRSICDKGRVYETVNGIRKAPGYTCSVCHGEGFVPSTDYRGAVSDRDALLTYIHRSDHLKPADGCPDCADVLAALDLYRALCRAQ